MHETLDEFKFRQDSNTDSGVIYLCASEKSMYNVLNTLAPSYYQLFFILQVTRTALKTGLSSKFIHIGSCTVELAALECLKKIPIDLQWEKCCEHFRLALSFLNRLS